MVWSPTRQTTKYSIKSPVRHWTGLFIAPGDIVTTNLCFLTAAFAGLHFHSLSRQQTVERTITDLIAPENVVIANGLFTAGTQPRLIGGRDRETGGIVFPCPTGNSRFDPVELPRRGRIWSWTIQRFRPKTPPYTGPDVFDPFAIGYVELPDAVIVETRLTNMAFDAIYIGMEVETVTVPVGTDAQGRTVIAYAFSPVAGQSPEQPNV
jgi:uncharacterized OB-fold protein